jgi:hypothetical protein
MFVHNLIARFCWAPLNGLKQLGSGICSVTHPYICYMTFLKASLVIVRKIYVIWCNAKSK